MSKIVKVTDPQLRVEPQAYSEPFMMREHTAKEVADYDAGFKAGECGDDPDETKSRAWQTGWAEANE
jgi:hypothetical protein